MTLPTDWNGDVLSRADITQLGREANGAISYPLAYPIENTIGNEALRVDTVSIERPKGRHMRRLNIKSGATSAMLDRIGELTGLAKPQVDNLDEYDILGDRETSSKVLRCLARQLERLPRQSGIDLRRAAPSI